jgi:hypothetical protein
VFHTYLDVFEAHTSSQNRVQRGWKEAAFLNGTAALARSERRQLLCGCTQLAESSMIACGLAQSNAANPEMDF